MSAVMSKEDCRFCEWSWVDTLLFRYPFRDSTADVPGPVQQQSSLER